MNMKKRDWSLPIRIKGDLPVLYIDESDWLDVTNRDGEA
jgi:hypothetical protein